MKKILKQIKNERLSNLFLYVELLVVFVVLWFIADELLVTLKIYHQPMGFDIENTYVLKMNRLNEKSTRYDNSLSITDDFNALEEIVDRISHREDVEAVCIAQNSVPYSDGMNGFEIYFLNDPEMCSVSALKRWVTPDFYNVFKIQNADGSGSQSLVDALDKCHIIVSEDLTDRYDMPIKGADMRQQQVKISKDSPNNYTISALTTPGRRTHFIPTGETSLGTNIGTLLTYEQMCAMKNVIYLEVALRVKKGYEKGFVERLMADSQDKYQVGNVYILDIMPTYDKRLALERDDVNAMQTNEAVLFFLLLNIFLGVIGTFWFRTQQRTAEVALHMVLGATPQKVFCRLILEGTLLLILAAIPAIIIAFNVGFAELVDVSLMPFGAERFLMAIFLTFVIMLLMIVAGIAYPAYQAMRIEPAEALRGE